MNHGKANLRIDSELDAEVAAALPAHFGGPKRASQRVTHVLRLWLDEHNRQARDAHVCTAINGRDSDSDSNETAGQ